MSLESTDVAWAWFLATLVFLILLGTGRVLRGNFLGELPFGGGVVLSAALGIFVYSMLWMGLGHFGALHAPWPWAVFGLGVLLALPGLLFTLRDARAPAAGLEPGFGPRWFAGGAWFFLLASLLVSVLWISGVTSYGGIGFLFERAGLDYAAGHTFYDAGFPRDPFLGDEPLDLWLFGLGAPLASLALSWWLGVAILFGVCGLGWRLHHHAAGLAAAGVLALVLFASDRPLFFGPALPAAVALVAVLVLLVESRGAPHLGRTLTAGGLGGFALISDLGALAVLLPLLLFGPLWCKTLPGASVDGAGKWGTPLRHTGLGLLALLIPLLPWMARSAAWTGDPCFGFDPEFVVESDYRFYDADRELDGFQPSFRFGRQEIEELVRPRIRIDEGEGEDAGENRTALVTEDLRDLVRPRLQIDPLFVDYDVDFGAAVLDDTDFFDGYLCATEWGLGILLAALLAPFTVLGPRRRERFFQILPAVGGYAAGAYLGDFETTTPAALAFLSVGAGQALYDVRGCGSTGRNLTYGGTLATGGLALGLSGAHDCGYWPSWGDYPNFPQFEFVQLEDEPQRVGLDGYELRLRYYWDENYGEDLPAADPQVAPPTLGTDDEEPEIDLGVGLKYDYDRGLDLKGQYRDDAVDATGTSPTPETLPNQGARPGPKVPTFRPDPNVQPNLQPAPKIPVQPRNMPQQNPGSKSYPGPRN